MSGSGGAAETTLFMLKPDAVVLEGCVGACLEAAETLGAVRRMKMRTLSLAEVAALYAGTETAPHYPRHAAFMTSGPVIAVELIGVGVVARLRALIGATNPANAAEGTLRRRFGTELPRNAVHASDSVASAARELRVFWP